MTEEQVYKAFRLSVSRNARQVQLARQNVYCMLGQIYGKVWLSKHSSRIKQRLEEIEKEVLEGVPYEP